MLPERETLKKTQTDSEFLRRAMKSESKDKGILNGQNKTIIKKSYI